MKHFLLIVFILSLNTARLSAQDWRTDWDIAKVEAEQANKKLILVFSGSDWCIPCIKLEKEIWESHLLHNMRSNIMFFLERIFQKERKTNYQKRFKN